MRDFCWAESPSWAWDRCCARAVKGGSDFLMLDKLILFQLSKGVSSSKQQKVQPSRPGWWKRWSQWGTAGQHWASRGQGVRPPPGVIGHLVGPPLSSWPTIGYCILNVRFQDSDLAHQEKVWALWPIRWKRKDMSRGDSHINLQTLNLRHWESEGSGGKTWKEGQDRHSTGNVFIHV